jgi:hypothetical protein
MRVLSYPAGLGALALALWAIATPAQAVTCAEVRNLSAADTKFWAERLEVSPRYLSALLREAFCDLNAARERVAANGQRRSAKPRSAWAVQSD